MHESRPPQKSDGTAAETLLKNRDAILFGGEGPWAERSPARSPARAKVFLAGC
jgi:hypothetical protein